MTRWLTQHDNHQMQIVLMSKTPLITCATASLTLADGHNIALQLSLKYAHVNHAASKQLTTIRIDDLSGNGDTTPNYRNRGYGSALVATSLQFIAHHSPLLANNNCVVIGQMAPSFDLSSHSSARRAAFWQKMGMRLAAINDPESKFSGRLYDATRERFAWQTPWYSALTPNPRDAAPMPRLWQPASGTAHLPATRPNTSLCSALS